jgi:hypothetical protein
MYPADRSRASQIIAAMPRRTATVVRTGLRVEGFDADLARLYARARALYPEGFPAEETTTLEKLYAEVSYAFVAALRREVAAKLGVEARIMPLDLFQAYGCGPIALHDDRFRFPGVRFVIVVVHSGRLGVVDRTSRAQLHEPGDILLLDPYRKHALVPAGRTAREHPYERTHSLVTAQADQFVFLDFDVERRWLRERFRNASAPAGVDPVPRRA